MRTDPSKITEKKLNRITLSDTHKNHINEANYIAALQIPNNQMKEKSKKDSIIEQTKQNKHNQDIDELTAKRIETSMIVSWVGPTNTVSKRGKCACKSAGAH